MAAFFVQSLDENPYERGDRVIFAKDLGNAKLLIDEDCETVIREPRYDKYESSGFGAKEKNEEGWQIPCYYCENIIGKENYSEDGALVKQGIVTFSEKNKDIAYCSRKCQKEQIEEWNRNKKQKTLTLQKTKELFGEKNGFNIVEISGNSKASSCKCESPQYPGHVEFKFPGSLGVAHGCPHCQSFHCQVRDVDAWKKWRISFSNEIGKSS